MKIYRIAADWRYKHTIYEDETGYIKGYQADDGRWWIMEFAIKPEYRGKGLAKELAKHLPWKCRLYAWPMFNMVRKEKVDILGADQLKAFYKNLGFVESIEDNIMVRG